VSKKKGEKEQVKLSCRRLKRRKRSRAKGENGPYIQDGKTNENKNNTNRKHKKKNI